MFMLHSDRRNQGTPMLLYSKTDTDPVNRHFGNSKVTLKLLFKQKRKLKKVDHTSVWTIAGR